MSLKFDNFTIADTSGTTATYYDLQVDNEKSIDYISLFIPGTTGRFAFQTGVGNTSNTSKILTFTGKIFGTNMAALQTIIDNAVDEKQADISDFLGTLKYKYPNDGSETSVTNMVMKFTAGQIKEITARGSETIYMDFKAKFEHFE